MAGRAWEIRDERRGPRELVVQARTSGVGMEIVWRINDTKYKRVRIGEFLSVLMIFVKSEGR
jgi:hypothetical protein